MSLGDNSCEVLLTNQDSPFPKRTAPGLLENGVEGDAFRGQSSWPLRAPREAIGLVDAGHGLTGTPGWSSIMPGWLGHGRTGGGGGHEGEQKGKAQPHLRHIRTYVRGRS